MSLGDEPTTDPIPAAQIRLYSTEQIFEKRSDRAGDFRFASVPRGDYELEVSADGFKVWRTALPNLNSNVSLQVHLHVANQPSNCNDPEVSYGEAHSRELGHLVCIVKNFSNRKPLARAKVSVLPVSQTEVPKVTRPTNTLGRVFFDLPPGRYKLGVKRTSNVEDNTQLWIPRNNMTYVVVFLPRDDEMVICQ